MKEKKMIGIEKSKKAIKALTDLIERGEVVFEDGKVTWVEGLGSIKEIKNFIVSLFDMSDIVEEAKDYDEAEKSELLAYAKTELDLKNDKAEALIEYFFQVALGIGGMVQVLTQKSVGGGGPGGDPDPGED